MTEKRFKLTIEEDICYCEYTYWKGDEPLGMEEVVDVLNEQDDELHKYRTENAELHITILENEKEIDEQQATIQRMKHSLNTIYKAFEKHYGYDMRNAVWLVDELSYDDERKC